MSVLVQEGSGPHSHSGTQAFGGSAVSSSSVSAIMIPDQRKGKWPGGMCEQGFNGIEVANTCCHLHCIGDNLFI